MDTRKSSLFWCKRWSYKILLFIPVTVQADDSTFWIATDQQKNPMKIWSFFPRLRLANTGSNYQKVKQGIRQFFEPLLKTLELKTSKIQLSVYNLVIQLESCRKSEKSDTNLKWSPLMSLNCMKSKKIANMKMNLPYSWCTKSKSHFQVFMSPFLISIIHNYS